MAAPKMTQDGERDVIQCTDQTCAVFPRCYRIGISCVVRELQNVWPLEKAGPFCSENGKHKKKPINPLQ